ncbi:MAG: FAD:protein FMN transferase [Bacteroidales bacterium]|nr:FAD:protein FMN transferase [Bacteroidales bacterium]
MNIHYKKRSVRHLCAGRFLIACLSAATLAACHTPEPIRLSGEAQGTYYSVIYYDSQQRDLQPQIDSLLADFDLTASLWVDSSLLRRTNANLTDTLNPLLADLLQKSLYIHHYTGGAFDCRIGRLVQAWGFSFKQQEELDSLTLDSLLCAARATVTVDTVDGTLLLRKENPATELDFNAIAQGYASDLLAHYLESLGITSYLVDIGGEVVSHGTKADGRPWRVGIERPAEDRYSEPVVQTAIALRDQSVVTSGSYRKYYERDGIRYSHTIDPATGRPVGHTLLSVSVIERESWLADAMATAYMVMGLEKSKAFIAAHPDGPGTQAVFFIYDSCGSLATYATPEFERMILKENP